jgi:hypothetical protein
MRAHMLVHRQPLLKCPHCPELFISNARIKQHVKSHFQDSSEEHKCHCGKIFNKSSKLRRHSKRHQPTLEVQEFHPKEPTELRNNKKTEKQEQRAAIQLLFLKGLTTHKIKKELDVSLGKASPSFSTVKKWCAIFRRGDVSTNDAPRSGRPKTARNEETIETVRQMIIADRRKKLSEIAKMAGISTGTAFTIIHEDLKSRHMSRGADRSE